MQEPRFRCNACGNVTRFDVTVSSTVRSFHHYTVGGDLEIEEQEVLNYKVDAVVCRWCAHGNAVEEVPADAVDPLAHP